MLPIHSEGMRRLHVLDFRQAFRNAVWMVRYWVWGQLMKEIRVVAFEELRIERTEASL